MRLWMLIVAGIIGMAAVACKQAEAPPAAGAPDAAASVDAGDDGGDAAEGRAPGDAAAGDAAGSAGDAGAGADAGTPADVGAPDAGAPDAGAPDAGPALACACEAAEDCPACYARIATCCYDDPTWMGQVDRLAGNCARDGPCRACCNECAALSCEAVEAAHLCPDH